MKRDAFLIFELLLLGKVIRLNYFNICGISNKTVLLEEEKCVKSGLYRDMIELSFVFIRGLFCFILSRTNRFLHIVFVLTAEILKHVIHYILLPPWF